MRTAYRTPTAPTVMQIWPQPQRHTPQFYSLPSSMTTTDDVLFCRFFLAASHPTMQRAEILPWRHRHQHEQDKPTITPKAYSMGPAKRIPRMIPATRQ